MKHNKKPSKKNPQNLPPHPIRKILLIKKVDVLADSKSKHCPKFSSKNEAHDANDVSIDAKVLSPAPSTSGCHSDVYKGPPEWQIDLPKSDTNCGNRIVFGCDSLTEYLTQLDGSVDDNKAPH